MQRKRSKRKTRQLALTERDQRTPLWATLPEECRRQIVELLVRLVRNELAVGEEAGDE
jgi:hypothetical protein